MGYLMSRNYDSTDFSFPSPETYILAKVDNQLIRIIIIIIKILKYLLVEHLFQIFNILACIRHLICQIYTILHVMYMSDI